MLPVDANVIESPSDDAAEPQPKADPPEKPPKKQPPSPKHSPAVEALISMGFNPSISRLALRESDGETMRAADWILSRMTEECTTPERAGDDTIREMVDALARLEKETETVDEMCRTLDTLHVYLSNVQRQAGIARYRQINSANANYRRRVGRFRAAVDVLECAGFRRREGETMLRLGDAPDMAKVWTAKTIVQERLVKEFLR